MSDSTIILVAIFGGWIVGGGLGILAGYFVCKKKGWL
jgi:hypothetical protein